MQEHAKRRLGRDQERPKLTKDQREHVFARHERALHKMSNMSRLGLERPVSRQDKCRALTSAASASACCDIRRMIRQCRNSPPTSDIAPPTKAYARPFANTLTSKVMATLRDTGDAQMRRC